MRELTFRGYLTQYVKQLSKHSSTDMASLAAEAAEENPRLREPLTLYALFSGKQHTFLKTAEKTEALRRYAALLQRYTAEEVLILLSCSSPELSDAFHKVWHSYQTRKNRTAADDHSKSLMRSRILTLQGENRISNYRIYTDLNLNPGNVNAWLKHGAAGKISLDNARRVLQYVSACGAMNNEC